MTPAEIAQAVAVLSRKLSAMEAQAEFNPPYEVSSQEDRTALRVALACLRDYVTREQREQAVYHARRWGWYSAMAQRKPDARRGSVPVDKHDLTKTERGVPGAGVSPRQTHRWRPRWDVTSTRRR